MRKKVFKVCSLILILSLMMGSVEVKAKNEIREVSNVGNYTTEDIDDIQFAVKRILLLGTKDFYMNYPVDDSFLNWVASSYGREAVDQLAVAIDGTDKSPELWQKYTGCSIHALWASYCRERNYMTYNLDNTYWMEQKSDKIKLSFIGDINFDDEWNTMRYAKLQRGVENCITSDLREELISADITMANNEFTIGNAGSPLEGKDYTFRARSQSAQYYQMFGVDIASLANNHAYDYGAEGLLKTIELLNCNDIVTIGAGKNRADASKTIYYIVGGRKLAFVSATEIERFSNFTKEATEKEPGVFKMRNPNLLVERIKEAKEKSDYVIAYVHWGSEGVNCYEKEQERLAETIAEAGADAIIGGHSHRMQGLGFVEDVPVAYGLGNFWFSTGSLYTTVATITIDENDKLSLSMLPCIQDGLNTRMLTDKEEQEEFYKYLCDISKSVGFDENGTVYNLAEDNLDEKIIYKAKDSFVYKSGERDLKGNYIDIVGNLK